MHNSPPDSNPQKMPYDAAIYRNRISLTHFINAYYQVRDCLLYNPKNVLIVGVGTGLEPVIFRERFGLKVTTLDIDPGFNPDCIRSVHDLGGFLAGQFDVAVVSHVLEHLPFGYFETALKELARVSIHSVIYLPYGGRHIELRLSYAQRAREWALNANIPPMKRISGSDYVLQNGEHCWECGYPGFSIRRIKRILQKFFSVDGAYHNKDWRYSYNFRLTSRQHIGIKDSFIPRA